MNAMPHWFATLAAAALLGYAPASAQQAPPDQDRPTGARVDHDTVNKANESDIAKESENPIGNLTVLPFENYTNFGVGPHDGTQNILEFEPVVPIHLNQDWNLITRAVIPFVWNPDLSPFQQSAAIRQRPARKLRAVLSYRVAMARKSFKRQKVRSMTLRSR